MAIIWARIGVRLAGGGCGQLQAGRLPNALSSVHPPSRAKAMVNVAASNAPTGAEKDEQTGT